MGREDGADDEGEEKDPVRVNISFSVDNIIPLYSFKFDNY